MASRDITEELQKAVSTVMDLLPLVSRRMESGDDDDPPPLPPPIEGLGMSNVRPRTSTGMLNPQGPQRSLVRQSLRGRMIDGAGASSSSLTGNSSSLTGIDRVGSICTRAVSALRNVRCQAEQRVNFSPYEKGATKPLSIKFFCLSKCNSTRVPTSALQKMALTEMGLGQRDILMSSKLGARDMRDKVIEAFPPLANGGGFEYLHCLPNTRDLRVIPHNYTICPTRLKAFIGKGKVFISPLQKDIDTLCDFVANDIQEECLKCHHLVPITFLKDHVANCNKDGTDSEEEPPPKKLKTIDAMSSKDYFSLESVIDDFSDILDDSTSDGIGFDVSRENILLDSMKFFDEHWLDFPSRLYVSFRGETGIDAGGLEKEFWTLLSKEILRRYFEGEEGNAVVKRDSSSLINREYEKVGRIFSIGISLGHSFPFVAPCVYEYLCGTDPLDISCDVKCVSCSLVQCQVEEIQNATNVEEFSIAIEKSTDLIIQSGYTKPLPHLKIVDKEDLVHTILLYLCILKSKAELDQLKEGLQFLGVGHLMSRLKDTMKPLFFVPDVLITADLLLSFFTVSFGKEEEECAYDYFSKYLADCEGNKENVSLEKILFFFSGLEKIPVFGFEPVPTLVFDSKAIYPKASVCLNKLILPTQHKEYCKFKEIMDLALTMHGGYGEY